MMWFRKGLRLHDNPALLEALQDAEHLFPVFCLDPGIIEKREAVVGVNRCPRLITQHQSDVCPQDTLCWRQCDSAPPCALPQAVSACI